MDSMFDSFITELESEVRISWDTDRLLSVPEIVDAVKDCSKMITDIRLRYSQNNFDLEGRALLDEEKKMELEIEIALTKYRGIISDLMIEFQSQT